MLKHLTKSNLEEIIHLSEKRETESKILKAKHGIDEELGIDYFDTKTRAYINERRSKEDELKAYLSRLSQEAIFEIEAVLWIGRGDAEASNFHDAVEYARKNSDAGDRDYIAEKPLHTYLTDGIGKLGL